MRRLLLPVLALVATALHAQDLAVRDSLIQELYKAERHAELAKAIDRQVEQVQGTAWQDSLHRYVYKYGRAMRKLQGDEAGIAAAEAMVGRVRKQGKAAHLLEALFDLSWIYYEAGRTTDFLRTDSLAVVVAQSDPAIPRAKRGKACQYLAFDYSSVGDHASSARYAQAALDEYAKADSIPSVQWSESWNTLGVAFWHLGRIRDAEAQYGAALKALERDSSEAAINRRISTLANLGVLWQNAGDLPRSRTYYYRSMRESNKLIAAVTDPSTRDEAIVNRSRTYLNLATVHHGLGDLGKAHQWLELAWADRSRILSSDDPQLLAVRERQGDVALASGDLPKAAELVRSYVAACEAKYGGRSEEYARAVAKLGEVRMQQGQAAQADSLFAISIAASKASGPEGTSQTLVQALLRRAALHAAAGDHGQAMAGLHEARQIEVNIGGKENYRVARVDVLLAEQAFALKQYAEARAFADTALHAMQDRIHAVQSSGLPLLFTDPHILPDAIYWKVRAAQALAPGSDPAEWNKELDMAIRYLARSHAAVKDESSKLLLVAAQQRLFDLALETAYASYAKTGSEQDLQRFFTLTETDRSILLKDRLNGFSSMRFAGVPDSLIALEQELTTAMAQLPEDREALAQGDVQAGRFKELLRTFEQHYPRYFDLRYGERKPTLAEVRKALLTPERQLLIYARTSEHLYALVIGQQQASITRLETAGLQAAVKGLKQAVDRRESKAFTEQAHALYQKVFAPVASRLTAPELLIVPGGELSTLNFELLPSEPGVAHYADHLLIQRYTMAYLLSATTAIQFAGLARERAKGVLALAPGFSDQVKQDYRKAVPDSTLLDDRFFRYVRQPFAVITAQALGRSPSAQVLTGQQASEGQFRQEAGKYGILYLGTHAEMDPSAPMWSRLVLSKGGAGLQADDDGYLHAYEIYELDLRAQLAVLTACESGMGKAQAGEGIRSLGASFAYAGCPSLVVALWNIDEKVSAQIITRFHELLSDGLPKHVALRQAKLEFLSSAKGDLVHPYYWAGLVLIGDVGPVEQERAWSFLWWAAAGLLLVFLVAWWSRRTRTLGP
jgi:CHAT domain-containing protein/tetratricopeptide (TPR) repeat protein